MPPGAHSRLDGCMPLSPSRAGLLVRPSVLLSARGGVCALGSCVESRTSSSPVLTSRPHLHDLILCWCEDRWEWQSRRGVSERTQVKTVDATATATATDTDTERPAGGRPRSPSRVCIFLKMSTRVTPRQPQLERAANQGTSTMYRDASPHSPSLYFCAASLALR